ncbi:MAG: Gfo/Idh/MocA family oxidoreductase [Nitrospirae bacterium]|nr:Gfo/Idh/MocA family oxidoreductase [Nitrospirota bacterium]
MKIAVIGCGHWGPNHIRTFNFLPDSYVSVVVDSDIEKANSIKRLYPHVAVDSDYRNLLKDKSIDAAVVATPTSTHYRIVRDLLESGKHVLCEKPLCTELAEAEELGRIAGEKGLILAVGYVFLFNNGISKLKELIESGALGALHYISISRTNLGPIRTDVNVVYDLMTHDLSILHHITGKSPLRVTGVGGSYLKKGIEDVAFVTLEYGDGLIVSIRASWLDPHKVRQITVVGNKKMALWDDLDQTGAITIYDKGVMQQPSYTDFAEFIRLRDGDITIPKIPFAEPLKNQDQYFISMVRQKKSPVNNAAFECNVLRVIQAVNESIKTGRSVSIG